MLADNGHCFLGTDIFLIFTAWFVRNRSKQFSCFKQGIQVCACKICQITKAEMCTDFTFASWLYAKLKKYLSHNLVSILVTK